MHLLPSAVLLAFRRNRAEAKPTTGRCAVEGHTAEATAGTVRACPFLRPEPPGTPVKRQHRSLPAGPPPTGGGVVVRLQVTSDRQTLLGDKK